jgi:hypothetical protein
LHLEFTLIFTTNFADSLDIRAYREVFPIGVMSPEIGVMKSGKIEGMGSYEELLAKKACFTNLSLRESDFLFYNAAIKIQKETLTDDD